MTTEHDEQLVERVALAMLNTQNDACGRKRISEMAARNNIVPAWMDAARAVIYPPAPPKTRLQVARELLAKCATCRLAAKRHRSTRPACAAYVR